MKKVVISARADFDERYFPMSKRPTSASFPALSVEVESTPSTTPAPVSRTSPADKVQLTVNSRSD